MSIDYKSLLMGLKSAHHFAEDNSNMYADEIYPISWFYSSPVEAELNQASDDIPSIEEPVETKTELDEKAQVVSSMTEFVNESLKETGEATFEKSKALAKSFTHKIENELPSTFERFKEKMSEYFSHKHLDARLGKDLKKPLKVLFISDVFIDSEVFEKIDDPSEFNTLYSKDTALLFSKMVSAMKLKREDYLLTAMYSSDKKISFKDLLLNEIKTFKPLLIISLGVTPTHYLLNRNDRLKQLHGKILDFNIESDSYKVMPIFSPNLLHTAPNTKRVAWEDMQKAMEFLDLQ